MGPVKMCGLSRTLFGMLGMALLIGSLGAGTGASGADDLLVSDPRLARSLTIQAPMATLGWVVEELARQADVRLEITPVLKERVIALTAHDRPAHEVLSNLAVVFDYTWEKAGDRAYRLTEGPEARSRRLQLGERIRRVEGAELEEYLQRVQSHLQQQRALTKVERFAAAQRLMQEAQTLPEGPERARKEAESNAAYDAAVPYTGPLLEAVAGLPAVVRQRLLAGERILLATARPGALPLQPEIGRALVDAARSRTGELPPGPPLPGVNVLTLDTRVVETSLGLSLSLRATAPWGSSPPPAVWVPRRLLSVSRGAVEFDLGRAFPGEVKVEAGADPGEKMRFCGTPPAPLSSTSGLWTYFPGETLPDLVDRTARSAPSWAFVGDVSLRPWSLRDAPERGPVTRENVTTRIPEFRMEAREGRVAVQSVAAALARGYHLQVQVAPRQWFRFRSTIYPLDWVGAPDPEAVRAALVPWHQRKSLTSSTAERLCTLLTARQLASLMPTGLGFALRLQDLHSLGSGWAGWRLLAGLSRATKKRLMAGESVVCGQFSAAEQRAVVAFLAEVNAPPDSGPPLDLLLGPSDLPRLALKLQGIDALSGGRTLELWLTGWDRPLTSTGLIAAWAEEKPEGKP